MKNPFEHTSASWVRYDDYEWREKDGLLYLLPVAGVKATPYDPMKDAEALVLAAMDIGLMLFQHKPEERIKDAMLEFARSYGLLGIMTALPTTPRFIEYEKVYFPYNQFVKTESMDTKEYIRLFFPFQMPDFAKDGVESVWNTDDKIEMALAMTYSGEPQAMAMSFMRNYAERYDWLATVFKDWAFTFMAAFLYYLDKDTADETTLELYRKGTTAFEGNAPTYHMELRERPTLVWDFHSLMLNIKMLFSLMLTDEDHPLRMCKQCQRAFIAPRANAEFCSKECRDKYRQEQNRKKR